jgi:hypothetical protein
MVNFPEKSFLGTGWAFPPCFGADNSVEMVSNVEDIRQSLTILFNTHLGERVLQPEYGCALHKFQFEPITAALRGYLHDLVERAILYHEPRIELENVTISEDYGQDAFEGRLIITVAFSIRQTNSRFNFVYDFYINEGATQSAQGVVPQAVPAQGDFFSV